MFLFRILLYVTTAFLCSTGWWVAIIPVALWYVYIFDGYEIVLLGALTDIHFNPDILLPYTTILFALLIGAVYWIKPRLMVYTGSTNV